MGQKIVFLGTGGTIAGTSQSESDNVGYKAAQVGIGSLLAASAPLKRALGNYVADAEQVLQINSKDMRFPDWQHLLSRVLHSLEREDVTAIVITHGTDTIEETAYFLHRVLPARLLAKKRVVLTCAMRPASSSNADGPANLFDATVVAVSPAAEGDVLVVCAGVVHAAQHVQKVHPYRLNPFDSGESGPIGYVEEGVFRRITVMQPQNLQEREFDPYRVCQIKCPRVEIVLSHSGASGTLVKALMCANDDEEAPLSGIVVAGTGNGSIHTDLEAALREAEQSGVWVWRTSRCSYGRIVLGPTSLTDEFTASPVSAVKARIDMLLALSVLET
jgi:L-asparaginase